MAASKSLAPLTEAAPRSPLNLRKQHQIGHIFYGLSATLFFLAWVVSLFDFLPFVFQRQITFLVTYALRMLGYVAWKGYIYACFSCHETLQQEAGSEITNPPEFNLAALSKDKTAAWLGLLACVSASLYLVCSPIATVALLAGLWTLVASNVVWTKGCHEQAKNQSGLSYQARQQNLCYRNYAALLTATSLFLTAAVTVSLVCPSAAAFFSVTVVASFNLQTTIGATLGAASIGCLFKSYYHQHKNNHTLKNDKQDNSRAITFGNK